MFFFKSVVRLSDLAARKRVQLRQTADLKLVDLNAVRICTFVKVHGDELENELFDKVQDRPNENGNYNLIESVLPTSRARIPIDVMVFHGRQKRYFYT